MPKLGYWQKLKFKKITSITELPNPNHNPKIVLESTMKLSPLASLAKEIEEENPHLITIPQRISKPHALTVVTKKYLEDKKTKRDYTLRDKTLPVSVTKTNEARALKFMDGLLKLLEARGHSLIKEGYESFVVVFDVKLEIYLREINKRIPPKDKYSSSDLAPTGLLALKTNRWSKEKEWRDSKTKSIEDMLPKIVAQLELDAIEHIELYKRIERDRKIREQEEQIRKEKEALIKKEVAKIDGLIKDSENHKLANNIRCYIKALEKQAIDNNLLTNEVIERIKWAREKADWIDPLINTEDDLLGEYKPLYDK